MICVGHHCHPNLPLHDFPGTDRRAINNLPVYSRRRGAETLCTSGNLVQCDYVLTEGSTTQRVQLNILILGLRLHSKGCKVYFKCKLHQREIIFYAKSRMTLLSVLSEASTRSRESSSTAETTRPPMSGGTRRSSWSGSETPEGTSRWSWAGSPSRSGERTTRRLRPPCSRHNDRVLLVLFFLQLYLSTRRGAWILNRVGDNGLPADMKFNRVVKCLRVILPFNLLCGLGESMLNKRFDHTLYNLKPKHRYWVCICFFTIEYINIYE